VGKLQSASEARTNVCPNKARSH